MADNKRKPQVFCNTEFGLRFITKQNGESISSFCIILLHTVCFMTEINAKPSILSPVSSVWSVVSFPLGDSSASEFCVLMFRNNLSHLHRSVHTTYEDATLCSEMSAHKIWTPRNDPKERHNIHKMAKV
jgi:hypothetical protein